MKTCKKGLHSFDGKRCFECKKVYVKSWGKRNKDKLLKNKENFLKKIGKTNSQYCIESYYNNPEKYRKIEQNWRKNNLGKNRAKNVKYHSAKLNRTPKWLTSSDWIEINWVYELAAEMTKETGIKYEVDHIVPLQGKNISGLHCPQNLRIITKSENSSKRNKYFLEKRN